MRSLILLALAALVLAAPRPGGPDDLAALTAVGCEGTNGVSSCVGGKSVAEVKIELLKQDIKDVEAAIAAVTACTGSTKKGVAFNQQMILCLKGKGGKGGELAAKTWEEVHKTK